MSKGISKAASTSSPKAPVLVAATSPGTAPTIASAQRAQMIAEAAYYRAEHRGFQSGDPQQDWLEAEAEIDRILGGKLH